MAASFIDELADLIRDGDVRRHYSWIDGLTVEATAEVLANVSTAKLAGLPVREVTRLPTDGRTWSRTTFHEAAFTIFGPAYGPARGRRHIVGFADPTSLFSMPTGQAIPPASRRIRRWTRSLASRFFFSRADRLVVEAPHIKDALVTRWGLDPTRIEVVPNCINAALLADTTQPRGRSGWCYITRNYPHKNLALLGAIGDEMVRRGEPSPSFTVTLTPAEWGELEDSVRRYCRNIGPIAINEVAPLYKASEGSVFPSLLEAFSVSPLESLATETPLIASDRAFVTAVCRDAALYADPLDPVPWVEAMLRLQRSPELRKELIRRGAEIARRHPTARDRASEYLRIIDKELSRI